MGISPLYSFINVNVGLVTFSVTLNALATPRVNTVLPAPNSPLSAITVPGVSVFPNEYAISSVPASSFVSNFSIISVLTYLSEESSLPWKFLRADNYRGIAGNIYYSRWDRGSKWNPTSQQMVLQQPFCLQID